MKDYKYIFWDLDGTITSSAEGITNCIRYALTFFDQTLDMETMLKFIGPPLRDSFAKYCGMDKAQAEEAVRRYRERYIPIGLYECSVFEGAEETLKYVRESGKKQYLTSSKPEAQCRQLLTRLGLVDYFHDVVGATPDGRIDAKQQVLQEAFRRIGEETGQELEELKEQAVLIGDTMFDAEGAALEGIDFIGVTYGFGSRQELERYPAVGLFDTTEELRRGLLGWD